MLDLNDMLYFAEVVDRGSFAAAGRALGLPKSRLSRRIAELEERLGVRLLQRTTRKLSMTDIGERYHRHCVAMREQAQEAAQTVEQAHSAPQGLVRIACPVTLAHTTIGPLVPRFLERYPLVRIDMRVSNRAVDLVEEGFDIALRVRPSLDDSGSMVVKTFGPGNGALVASPAQLARQGPPTRVEDIAQLDTVAMDNRGQWTLQHCDGRSVTLPHQPRYVVDDLLSLKYAVLAGIGISMLPTYLIREELQRGELVPVLPPWAPPPAIFHAVFPSRRGLVPAVRGFLDFLGEVVAREGLLPA
jgi:DNA-binding transcriptional LysR family regulator